MWYVFWEQCLTHCPDVSGMTCGTVSFGLTAPGTVPQIIPDTSGQ